MKSAPKFLKILVIEDNLINQRLASTLFSRLGHQVDVAMNGLLGVELFKEKKHDLILMDIQMPVMTGLEAAQAIREHEKNEKEQKPAVIIAVTTFNHYTDRENCLRSGMNDHISKPYKPDEILSLVSRLIPDFVMPDHM
ncbi:MAG: response regulator [Bacteroidales bacterium]|nr:response regulator [Bacteroidota bacterium]MCF8347894.1 response regulator [Bacteroidales bacterium]